jgi:hypothetical protein
MAFDREPRIEVEPSSSFRFFSNPVVGLVGTIASVLGVALAIYFYLQTKEEPNLTYYSNPAKAVLVRSGQASRLAASFDGTIIKSDITAVQIAIWNEGRASITASKVLKPIVLRTVDGSPILEASIRKVSRDVTRLSIGSSAFKVGRATLNWNILEQGDGGVIQVIYAGSPTVDVLIDGVVEGQRHITRLQPIDKSISSEKQYGEERNSLLAVAVVSLGLGIGALSLFIAKRRKRDRYRKAREAAVARKRSLKDKHFESLTREEREEIADWMPSFHGEDDLWIEKALGKFVDYAFPVVDVLFRAFPFLLIIFGVIVLFLFLRSPQPPFGF